MTELNLEEIIQKIKGKQTITNDELQVLWRKVDWAAVQAKTLWHLNEPRCSCNPCYTSWLEWGKKVYKDSPEQFEKLKNEALTRLKSRQASREYDERRREAERAKYAVA